MRAADEILSGWAPILSGLDLVPGSRGVFDISVDGEPVFRKATVHRFPNQGELAKRVGPPLEWRGRH